MRDLWKTHYLLNVVPRRLDGKNFVCKFEGFDELAALAFTPAQVEEEVNAELIKGCLRTALQVAPRGG